MVLIAIYKLLLHKYKERRNYNTGDVQIQIQETSPIKQQ